MSRFLLFLRYDSSSLSHFAKATIFLFFFVFMCLASHLSAIHYRMKRHRWWSGLCYFPPRTVSVTQIGMPICVTAKLAKNNSIRLRIVFSRVVHPDLTPNDQLTVILHLTLNDFTKYYVNEFWSVLLERAELLSANQITRNLASKYFLTSGSHASLNRTLK